MGAIRELALEQVDLIGPDRWAQACSHSDKFAAQYYEHDEQYYLDMENEDEEEEEDEDEEDEDEEDE
jgi:hypothetical protein